MPSEAPHPLRGRDTVLDTLRSPEGRSVLVHGGEGLGKSALIAELRATPGLRVLGVRGHRAERSLPLGALHRMCGARVSSGHDTHQHLLSVSMPTLCWIDDAQWVDAESLAALGFAGRRLSGHPVTMVMASRTLPGGAGEFGDADTIDLAPLPDDTADLLLRDHGVPASLRPQLVELGGGNPADLIALTQFLTPAHAAGREPLSAVLVSRLPRYSARLSAMSSGERLTWLTALLAAPADISEATRSTWYEAAAAADRRAAHAELAKTLDGPDALWHRAMATAAPSSTLADQLASAPAADHAKAARQLERAASLTADLPLRAERLLAAAGAAWQAGRPGWARLLLSQVEHRPGAVALLHGEIELRDGDPIVAAHDLTTAAAALPTPAAAQLLAGEARRLAGDLDGYRTLALTVGETEPHDVVSAHFAGLTATFDGRYDDAQAPLEQTMKFGMAAPDAASAVWASEAAFARGQVQRAHDCAAAAVSRARLGKRHAELPWALTYLALASVALDRIPWARAAARDGLTGPHNVRHDHLALLALTGALLGERAPELDELAQAPAGRILGRTAAVVAWAKALLDLADDRPHDALGRLEDLASGAWGDQPVIRLLATPQLVDAAVATEQPDRAARALVQFGSWADSTGDPTWQALDHRCQALVTHDTDAARHHFDQALAAHRAAGSTLELARTQLAYATILRRNRRAKHAREQFRDALRGFDNAGAVRYAERARAGLRATGETAATTRGSLTGLTPQQEGIARLVASGETNKEIARRLVISPRTVDHHLRNIFTTLGVRSRIELAQVTSSNSP